MSNKSTKGWNIKENALVSKPKTIASKINVNNVDFDDLIKNQGVRVKVYRTAFCPKVKSIDSAEHEIDCDICYGAQFVDRYPISTWAFLQNQSLEKGVFPEGHYDGNEVSGTFLQGIELQYFTLVELCDFTEVFFERIKRQTGNIDRLRYKGCRVNLIIDYDGVEYFEGSDFGLDANGSIKWKAGKGPATNVIYSIHYETAVRFRAIKAQHSNRFVQVDQADKALMVKMNEQWQLQKDYLVERKDFDGNPLGSNQISDS